MNEPFPNRLYELRKERKETQETVAKMFGMTRATLCAYEKGKIVPPYDKVVRLAEHFGVSVDYLLGQTTNRNGSRPQTTDDDSVDVLDRLRTLKADVKDRTKTLYMNGKLIKEVNRVDISDVIDSIITILERMI